MIRAAYTCRRCRRVFQVVWFGRERPRPAVTLCGHCRRQANQGVPTTAP